MDGVTNLIGMNSRRSEFDHDITEWAPRQQARVYIPVDYPRLVHSTGVSSRFTCNHGYKYKQLMGSNTSR